MKQIKKTLVFFITAALLFTLSPLFLSAGAGRSGADVPPVIPALREWNGAGKDRFELAPGEVGISGPEDCAELTHISEAFREMCGIEVPCGAAGAKRVISFELNAARDASLGDEGYTLDIRPDSVKVAANTEKGLLYGGITLVQMAYAEGGIRCGTAKDRPEYPVRAGMIDVGRAWIPLDYVEQMTKFMAWFKLNEIHLHINDDNGQVNTGFRLESDVPGLSSVVNGEKRYYTKDEYRAYQKRMLEYGITVVTEIDTPAHSGAFYTITEGAPAMLNERFLDITDEHRDETVEFVKKLFDEYLTGDDPVFVGKTVHIGTDEYDREYSEEMRKYTAAIAQHVYSRGYIPRFWAGFGKDGFPGRTELPKYLQCSMWDNGISGLEEIVAGGYDMINTINGRLYVVPGSESGFADRYDLKDLYTNWDVWRFNSWGSDNKVDPHYDHLLGACFALWNDYYCYNYGITEYDVFDRIRAMSCLMAEKAWCGGDTAEIGYENFAGRYEKLSPFAGFSDPGGRKAASGFGFSCENGAHTSKGDIVFNGEFGEEGFILDGASFISGGDYSVGFPLTVDMVLRLDSVPQTPLFGGGSAALYADRDGKGRVGFTAGYYTFLFDCAIPLGEETRLTFICDGKNTRLAVDGTVKDGAMTDAFCYDAVNQSNASGSKMNNLYLPLAEIGKGFTGYIKSLEILPYPLDVGSLYAERNVALGADVSVSGLEVQDGRFTAEMAVDGESSTRLSFARDSDEQWLVIDLGAPTSVSKIEIEFYEHVESYDIFVSEDGADYKKAVSVRDGETMKRQTDVHSFASAPLRARFIKYVQNKRNYIAEWNTYYSGGISEVRVFDFDRRAYNKLIEDAYDAIAYYGKGAPEASVLQKTAAKLEAYLKKEPLYTRNIESLAETLRGLIPEASGASSAPESAVPGESSALPEESGNTARHTALVILAAVIAVAAAVMLAIKARRMKREKEQ
ncbi:MAG: family 20 glycosylhydrolase [Clostridia bacterium]|nr:family 20 glycosylhydrolase [Clostridia bacterium]